MKPVDFLASLKGLKFDNVFNPYSDTCPTSDYSDAPETRSRILLATLEKAKERGVESMWIGRDLGYRGGRRTGLALTDDAHLIRHGLRWGIEVERATRGDMSVERTATIVWDILDMITQPALPFLWNVFPFHPHEPGNPFSNRPHTKFERKIGEDILLKLVYLLMPRLLVAVGNDADSVCSRMFSSLDIVKVRHPSYGGQTDFQAQVCELYDLPPIGKHTEKSLF